MKYLVKCRIAGCPNAYLEIEIESETYPQNVICGPCENQITDIQEIVSEEPILE